MNTPICRKSFGFIFGVLVVFLLSTPYSYAQTCVMTGSTNAYVSQLEASRTSAETKIMKDAYTLLDKLSKQIVEAGNTVISGKTVIYSELIKALAGMKDAELEVEKSRLEAEKTYEANQAVKPNENDCVINSQRKYEHAGNITKKTYEDILNEASAKEATSVPFDDSAPGFVDYSKGLTYAYGKVFADYINNYCDPNENGGNMPKTEATGIPYINPNTGQEETTWCGRDRNDDQDYLIGAPQNTDIILGNGIKNGVWSAPEMMNPFNMLRRNLIGNPPEQINISNLDTLSSKTAYIQNRAQITKHRLVEGIINEAGARRMPTRIGMGKWLRGVMADSAGNDTELREFYMEHIPDDISEVQMLEGEITEFTDLDYLTGTLARIDNPTKMMGEFNKLLVNQLKLGYIRMQQAEKRNLILATMLAETIGEQ